MHAIVTILSVCVAPYTQETIAHSTHAAVLVAYEDASKLNEIDEVGYLANKKAIEQGAKIPPYKAILPRIRYFWFPYDKVGQEDVLITAKLLLNKLSSYPEFHTPTLIAANVIRVRTDELGWGEHQLSVLERFSENGIDVFFHQKKTFNEEGQYYTYWPGGKSTTTGKNYERGRYNIKASKGDSYYAPSPWLPEAKIDSLRKWTYSEVPILNFEQFYLYTVRQQSLFNEDSGVGYYEWFGKKGIKNRDDYFEVVGLDAERSKRQFKDWRALIQARKSGVANNSRFVFALQGTNGRVWGTEDFFAERDKGLAALRLRRGESIHQAEEYFGPLSNGLPVTALINAADGKVQAKAPPEVGGDKSKLNVGNDPAIHNDLSCMRCHAENDMLMPFRNRDWVRNYFVEGKNRKLTDPDPDVELELRRQYKSDIHGLLKKDQADYAEAVAKCTASARHPNGLTSAKAFDIYCKMFNRLAEANGDTPPITRPVLARNIGVSEKELVTKLNRYFKFRGQGNLIAARFLDDDGAMSWEELESTYAFFVGITLGEAIPEKFREEKKQ